MGEGTDGANDHALRGISIKCAPSEAPRYACLGSKAPRKPFALTVKIGGERMRQREATRLTSSF
jgi:hypothetical protein